MVWLTAGLACILAMRVSMNGILTRIRGQVRTLPNPMDNVDVWMAVERHANIRLDGLSVGWCKSIRDRDDGAGGNVQCCLCTMLAPPAEQ